MLNYESTVRRSSFSGFNLLLSVFNVSRCVDTNFTIMLAVVFLKEFSLSIFTKKKSQFVATCILSSHIQA